MKKIFIMESSTSYLKELYEYLSSQCSVDYLILSVPFKKQLKNYVSLLKKISPTEVFRRNIIVVTGTAPYKIVFFSKNIVFVNHGWATKKSPGNYEVTIKKNIQWFINIRKYVKYVVCLSDFDSTYYARHPVLDHLPYPAFVPLGHPRNDYLVKNRFNMEYIENIRNILGLTQDELAILYAPTHRETDDNNIKVMEKLLREFRYLDKYLNEKRFKILFRPHYYINFPVENEFSQFNNIILCSFEKFPDVRPLMLASNWLLTDYSSIFVDYLLLQKPIIFYPFDLEFYEQIRGLVIDYNNPLHVPGPKIKSLKDLIEIEDMDLRKYDLNRSLHFFHKYTDDKACERISHFIFKISDE